MDQKILIPRPPKNKPLLIYDGDCNFCRRWIRRWQAVTLGRVQYAASQQVAASFPEIPAQEFTASVILIETDGSVYRGAEAVFRSLAHAPGRGVWLWLYRNLPPFAWATERFYALVAGHRQAFSKLTSLLWGRHTEPQTYFFSRWLFLRLLGLVYLAAFASAGTQVLGLIGSQGIQPAADYLAAVARQTGPERFHLLPTLCWLNASDGFLLFLCWGGAGMAALVVLGVAQPVFLFLLWLFYLSLSCVGGVFLEFQWDALLLETGMLAIFLAPLQLMPRPSRETSPPSLVIGLLKWLLFRLMFYSGLVKLVSHDPAWRSLTALNFHYFTQPLPTWIGWYAQHLPSWFHQTSVGAMFSIELGAPFLFFLPRRLRYWGAGATILLQALILLTGNYCFFNFLTIALCLLLLDDSAWPASWRKGLGFSMKPKVKVWPKPILRALAAVICMVSGAQFLGVTRLVVDWPAPVTALYGVTAPFRSINTYGLFAVMTTTRPEIIVEGSRDGKDWQAYEFKYKAGDLSRPLRFVEPLQPRLDWQMWFAALGSYRENEWFISFCHRLLQGSPPVLALLEKNPFPDGPPRYIRAQTYDYTFTDLEERARTGQWWRRESKGTYLPPVSLESFQGIKGE